MGKKTNETLDFRQNKIILRSVFDKSNIKYYIQPCRDKYGHYPDHVKPVDENNNLILSDNERNDWSERKRIFIKESEFFTVYNGKVYNLDDKYDKAEWEAIKNCPLIAKSRDEKDANGNLVIDGTNAKGNKAGRNGVAELYVDIPGLETQRRISRKQLIFKAQSFIYGDEAGLAGQRLKAKLLGRDMSNQPEADVLDYLVRIAEKNPEKIIDLYTGGDTQLRLLFIDAKDKKVIYVKNKLYMFADNIVLGATDDAVITWMKDPKNNKVLELIRRDTYPDMYPID